MTIIRYFLMKDQPLTSQFQGFPMATYAEGKVPSKYNVFIIKELIALERLGQKLDGEPSILPSHPSGKVLLSTQNKDRSDTALPIGSKTTN